MADVINTRMMEANFEEVLKVIDQYYPIGLNELDPLYVEHEKSVLYQEVILKNENRTTLRKWRSIFSQISKYEKKTLDQNLLSPSYVAEFTIESQKLGRGKYVRKFYIYLSLLGEFYTMYGMDHFVLKNKNMKLYIPFEPVLYPWPFDIYESWYSAIHKIIQEEYPTHKFIPYNMLKKRIKNLSVAGANIRERLDACVFQALFSFDDINDYRVMRDMKYW